MASEAQILNLAALAIGTETRIASLNDGTFIANTLKTAWDVERQAMLREGVWNFSVSRTALAAEADVDPALLYPWAARYPMPRGWLRLLDVLGYSREHYQIEGNFILAHGTGRLPIRYVADVPEPTSWDPAFAKAFALRLALVCGDRIAGSAFDRGGVQNQFEAAVGGAKRSDGTENPPIEQEDGSWITARYGDDRYRRPGWEIT